MSLRFVFDPNRCVGCQVCVVACTMENSRTQTQMWRCVHTFNAAHHPFLRVQHLSLACNHCEDPACVHHCPSKAYAKDKVTGAVTHNPERCIGCRYCIWACPFDAPKLSESNKIIEKCTFCLDRLRENSEPACSSHCPLGALAVEEVPHQNHLKVEATTQDPFEAASTSTTLLLEKSKEPAVNGLLPPEPHEKPSDIEFPPAFPMTTLRPSIRFVSLRRKAPPDMKVDGGKLARFLDPLLKPPPSKITLRGEWPFLIFTQIFAMLCAWVFASLLGGPHFHPAIMLILGAAALGLPIWHLGKRKRAWRAICNFSTSWLSRGIILVVLFILLGFIFLLSGNQPVGWMAGTIGFASLIAIDQTYAVGRHAGPSELHSAQVLLGAVFFLGILAKLPVLALSAGGLKLFLYLHRKVSKAESLQRMFLSISRLALGFFAPWMLASRPLTAVFCALIGEMIDRAEFYLDLDLESPERELVNRMRQIFKPKKGNYLLLMLKHFFNA